MVDIGNLLHIYREAACMTQAALGKKVGTSQSIIGRYERNEVVPTITRFLDICKALNVTPFDLAKFAQGALEETGTSRVCSCT